MRLKDDEKRARILEHAAPLFAAKYFHEVTLDEVAERAAVGKGTIYTYFRDKEGLYEAVVADLIVRLFAEFRAAAEATAEPRLRLRGMVQRCLAFLRAHPHAMPLFQREEVREHAATPAQRGVFDRWRGDYIGGVSAVIQSAVRGGEFRVGHPDLAAALFLGMIRAAHLHPPPGFTVETLADAVTDLFLNGVAAR
jgi:AcrR family transcriptional regulator